MTERFFINMPIPSDKFELVCAVLAGTAAIAARTSSAGQPQRVTSAPVDEPSAADTGSAGTGDAPGASGVAGAPDVSGEIDAHGHPWSAELHASTKGKTKDGLWRMKVGVSRPDPKPGFPVDNGTGTSSATDTTSSKAPTPAPVEEDDEFAAFRNAAAASDATDAAAAANVPARKYSDADLGALCNQAAVKLGDPSPIKEIIASFTPEGQVAHSRNIPDDKRAEFVKAVETKAGIEFAG